MRTCFDGLAGITTSIQPLHDIGRQILFPVVRMIHLSRHKYLSVTCCGISFLFRYFLNIGHPRCGHESSSLLLGEVVFSLYDRCRGRSPTQVLHRGGFSKVGHTVMIFSLLCTISHPSYLLFPISLDNPYHNGPLVIIYDKYAYSCLLSYPVSSSKPYALLT